MCHTYNVSHLRLCTCVHLHVCVSACVCIYVHHNFLDYFVKLMRLAELLPEAYLHFMQREEVEELHVVSSLQLLEVHSACHTRGE
jgi:hypothetical protein